MIFVLPIPLLIFSSIASMGGGGDLEDMMWDVSDKQKKFLISATSSVLISVIAFAIFMATKK
jgi:hypothetical protein